MKLQILGAGGAFTGLFGPSKGNSMIYCDSGDPKTSLLFDCGRTLFENAKACGFDLKKIHNVWISHCHSDHIGGLPDLALACYFIPGFPKRPRLFSKSIIVDRIWGGYLEIQLKTLAHNQLPAGQKEAYFHDYFDVHPINGENESFTLGDTEFTPIQTVHVVNGYSFMPSYGLIINTGNKKVLITGDTQHAPSQLAGAYGMVDIIINDCEAGPFQSGVHAHVDGLKTLPEAVRKKMYLIHTPDNMPESIEGFAGVLKQGDVVEV